jgi:G protein-coupled receptor 107
MFVNTKEDEGLYNLYFHACPNYDTDISKNYWLSFDADIEEVNNGNYLSATEMPLPVLYFMMSLVSSGSTHCDVQSIQFSKFTTLWAC